MSPFAALKQDTASTLFSLRGDLKEVPPEKEGEAYTALRRLLCGVVRYPGGHIQAFNTLLAEGSDMVLDLENRVEVIEVPTLRTLLSGGQVQHRPVTMPSLSQLAELVH